MEQIPKIKVTRIIGNTDVKSVARLWQIRDCILFRITTSGIEAIPLHAQLISIQCNIRVAVESGVAIINERAISSRRYSCLIW